MATEQYVSMDEEIDQLADEIAAELEFCLHRLREDERVVGYGSLRVIGA